MDRDLLELENHLKQMLAEHQRLLELVRRKRQAMASASVGLVSDCCQRENECVQRIGRLEKSRQELVARITTHCDADAREPMTLGQIADRAGEPARGRLRVLHASLRELMGVVRSENRVAQAAADGLLQHVRGVIQSVRQAMSASGTYGRQGITPPVATAASSFTTTA